MYNRVILIGRLTRDPELRYTPNGVAVCKFNLAVQRRFNRDEADFVDIVAWRGLGENCAKYISKGSLVAIEGRLQIRSYEGQDGQKRRATEVIADEVQFLDKRGSGSGGSSGVTSTSTQGSSDSWNDLGREVSLDDIDIVDRNGEDEIPF